MPETSWMLWLSHLPTWWIAGIIIGGGLVLSMLVVLTAHNYFTVRELLAHHEAASFKFMFIAELFAGMIAFLMVAAGDRYANAQGVVQDEVAAWRALAQVIKEFSPATAAKLREDLSQYATSVVNTEWPAMEIGAASPTSQQLFTQLLEQYFAIIPANKHQQSLLILGNQFISMAAEGRSNRNNNNVNHTTAVLIWCTLVSMVVFNIIFNVFFGGRSLFTQLFMGSVLGTGLLSSVFLIFILGNPFSGATAVSAMPFIELAQQ